MTATTNYDAAVREITPDLEYRAEFVPQSKSRNAGDKQPSLNWRVTFSRGGRELTTDYMQGIGHLPGYKYPKQSLVELNYQQWAAERGRYALTGAAADGGTLGVPAGGPQIPAPPIADVLHCLLLDAEVIDAGSFEEWASNFGYDPDSRKAEGIYRACLDTALQLRVMLGDATIERLREALQDL